MRFQVSLLAAWTVCLVCIVGNDAQAAGVVACPPMPQVFWWTTATHDKTVAYVKLRHGGNWLRYIEVWQQRLDLLADYRARNQVVVLRNEGVRLTGRGLDGYIEQVQNRVAVVHCLAKLHADLLRPGRAARGRLLADQAGCFDCHGVDGLARSSEAPILAAQQVWYLRGQLWAFQIPDNAPAPYMPRRRHGTMDSVTKVFSQRDIKDVAAYFASLPCVEKSHQAIRRPPVIERCQRCHGEYGIAYRPEVPNLAGQKVAYLQRQLSLFARGQGRPSLMDGPVRYHRFMKRAAFLSGTQVIAVTNYFARQQTCRAASRTP